MTFAAAFSYYCYYYSQKVSRADVCLFPSLRWGYNLRWWRCAGRGAGCFRRNESGGVSQGRSRRSSRGRGSRPCCSTTASWVIRFVCASAVLMAVWLASRSASWRDLPPRPHIFVNLVRRSCLSDSPSLSLSLFRFTLSRSFFPSFFPSRPRSFSLARRALSALPRHSSRRATSGRL